MNRISVEGGCQPLLSFLICFCLLCVAFLYRERQSGTEEKRAWYRLCTKRADIVVTVTMVLFTSEALLLVVVRVVDPSTATTYPLCTMRLSQQST